MYSTTIIRANMLLFSLLLASAEDCGEHYLTITITGTCTKYSCIGECRDDTCCLEKCFEGSEPDNQDMQGCDVNPLTIGRCSSFAEQTECMARNTNKSFEVCWRHVVYFISSHPLSGKIYGFNPVHCPCESENTRAPGQCWFPQCVNNSNCEQMHDGIMDIDVCCLNNDVFPKESDCEDNEMLDDSIHKPVTASTVHVCEELCNGGLCRMPDDDRLPACCKIQPVIGQPPDGSALNDGVIAVACLAIVLLLVVGALGIFYIYRIKQEENQQQIKKDCNTKTIELTGIGEMIQREEDCYQTGTNYNHDPKADQEPDIGNLMTGDDHIADEYDNESTPNFTQSVHSIDIVHNESVHVYDNRVFTGDNECSYESYNPAAQTTGYGGDEEQSGFDDENDHCSDE